MAQEFQDEKEMREAEQRLLEEDPLHDVKQQIESGAGFLKTQMLSPGAGVSEKLADSRVGETLASDNTSKLDDSSSGSRMECESASCDVVKGDVAETFAEEYIKSHRGSLEKKDEVGMSSGMDEKSTSGGYGKDDELNEDSQDQFGTKFKKLTGVGIPRGKPHFRISASHGNRGLSSAGPRSGGLARTGSGVPGDAKGSNDLKDFSAALLEGDSKSAATPLPETTGSHESGAPDYSLGTGLDMKDAYKSTLSDGFSEVVGERNAFAEQACAAKDTSAANPTAGATGRSAP